MEVCKNFNYPINHPRSNLWCNLMSVKHALGVKFEFWLSQVHVDILSQLVSDVDVLTLDICCVDTTHAAGWVQVLISLHKVFRYFIREKFDVINLLFSLGWVFLYVIIQRVYAHILILLINLFLFRRVNQISRKHSVYIRFCLIWSCKFAIWWFKFAIAILTFFICFWVLINFITFRVWAQNWTWMYVFNVGRLLLLILCQTLLIVSCPSKLEGLQVKDGVLYLPKGHSK